MGKPQFVCATCAKVFTRKDYLTRHELNHNDVKPFSCEQCNLTFTRSDLLGKHYKSKSHQRVRENMTAAGSGEKRSAATAAPSDIDLPERKRSARVKVTSYLNHQEEPVISSPPPQPRIVYPPAPELVAFDDTPELSGGFIDNILWFFNDASPVVEFDKGLAAASAPNSSSSPSFPVDTTNYFDIAPVYDTVDSAVAQWTASKVRLTEATRRKILDVFVSVAELATIQLHRFEDFLNLFWFDFSQTFPIIHQPTFDPNTCEIYLVISMIVIGMAHSGDMFEYELSIAMNKEFRRVFKQVIDESILLPLPQIQALVLHNFSAKNFGDVKLNSLAQIDHGPNILYLRFSGMLDTLSEPLVFRSKNSSLEELDRQWKDWVYYESCKRIVFFEFICDTQHVTFSKLELLPAFDIKLEMPCTDEVWGADSAVKFFTSYAAQPRGLYPRPKLGSNGSSGSNSDHEPAPSTSSTPLRPNSSTQMHSKWPSFLWSLKYVMSERRDNQKVYSMHCFSQFSRYIMLHGLMRICWDMRSQGLLDLGVVSRKKLSEFFKKLERGFANWKVYFDWHVREYEHQLKQQAAQYTIGNIENDPKKGGLVFMNNYGRTNASWANLSFFYTGLFTLYADITALTKFAAEYNTHPIRQPGAYKNLKEADYERTRMIVEQWARSTNGKLSLIEACKFLLLVHDHEETINTFSHVPGTVFLAALAVWCYEIKRDLPNASTLLKARRDGEDADLYLGIDYQVSQYFDAFGTVKHKVAREDAAEYFEMILKPDGVEVSSAKSKKLDLHGYEEFRERQLKTVAVVCYVLHLLRGCKWKYSVDLVEKLENVVQSYEK